MDMIWAQTIHYLENWEKKKNQKKKHPNNRHSMANIVIQFLIAVLHNWNM